MGWSCRRPGCSREAEVAITYDAVACQVWLDQLPSAPGGAQPLCAEHAARLSPPRGWVVLDRRDRQASLMTISPPVVEQAGRRGVARRRFPRRWGEFDEPRLEFVGPDDVGLHEAGADAGSAGLDTSSRLDSPVDVPAEGSDVGAAPAADASHGDSPVEEAPVDEPDADPADLAVLLKPKGRLLSRAFDLTGDQHSVLTGASGVGGDESPDDPTDDATDDRADQADAS